MPYGLLLALGLFYTSFSRKVVASVIVVGLCIYLVSAIFLWTYTGHYIPTQRLKYPPHLYWIAYAVFVSYILISVCRKIDGCKLFDNAIVRFIGRNTLWIYLWHICFVKLSAHISEAWSIKFLICVTGAVIVDFVQVSTVQLLERRYGDGIKRFTRFLKG